MDLKTKLPDRLSVLADVKYMFLYCLAYVYIFRYNLVCLSWKRNANNGIE